MDQNENTQPVQASTKPADSPSDAPLADVEQPVRESPTRARWRDRSVGFRGSLAMIAASLIVGGLAGTALGFALDRDGAHSGRGGGSGHHGRPFGDGEDRGLVPPGEGRVPPTTSLESESSSSAS